MEGQVHKRSFLRFFGSGALIRKDQAARRPAIAYTEASDEIATIGNGNRRININEVRGHDFELLPSGQVNPYVQCHLRSTKVIILTKG